MHAIAAEVEISKVEAKIDKQTNKKVVAAFLRTGEKGICQLKVEHELFRLIDRYVCRNMTSCIVWEGLPSEMKESTY